MSLVGMLREIAVVLEEVKRLKSSISDVKASQAEASDRLVRLEERDRLRDVEFRHFEERTKTATEATLAVGFARFDGDAKAKLVELEMRIAALENRGRQPPEAPLLPSP